MVARERGEVARRPPGQRLDRLRHLLCRAPAQHPEELDDLAGHGVGQAR